jgi:cytoskeletal protein RodZ
MYNILNNSFFDFWIAILLVVLLGVSFIIWVLIQSRQATKEDIDMIFTKHTIENQVNQDNNISHNLE